MGIERHSVTYEEILELFPEPAMTMMFLLLGDVGDRGVTLG